MTNNNDGDDIHNNKKKKRKRQKKNPLAAARGKKDIDKIWHTKSGDGYTLFVDYYGNQPHGVVCNGNNAEKDGNDTNSNTIRQQQDGCGSAGGTGGAGMSRASKKRRKKRKRSVGGGDGGGVSGGATVAAASSTSSNTIKPTTDNYDHNKLVQAAMMAGQQQPHNMYEFLTYLSKPLPLSFRIRNSISEKQKDLIRKELRQYKSLVVPVPFDKNVYQATTTNTSSSSHQILTKNNLQHISPLLKQFLNKGTNDGCIARQEIGSMLPVFTLQKLGYLNNNNNNKGSSSSSSSSPRILDLCASPGSKTLQVAELIIVGKKGGRVRANDVNMSRLQALKDAVKRSGISSSSSHHEHAGGTTNKIDKIIKYTNVDATTYKVPVSETKKYDVVICDVPCSGDGTCRKDPHIIPNWTPNISNALHKLQLQILQRALKCVRVNGIVSYSTCSLNPIEDEAVVAAALLAAATSEETSVNNNKDKKKKKKKKKNGESSHLEFRIVPIPPIDGLILRRGVTDWRVADYTYGKQQRQDAVDSSTASSNEHYYDIDDEERPRLRWHASFADAAKCGMEHASEGMWPPSPQSPSSGLLRLDRCSRLWPQDQNNGGFFVTFIQRISE